MKRISKKIVLRKVLMPYLGLIFITNPYFCNWIKFAHPEIYEKRRNGIHISQNRNLLNSTLQ